jgi:hypothetical protein
VQVAAAAAGLIEHKNNFPCEDIVEVIRVACQKLENLSLFERNNLADVRLGRLGLVEIGPGKYEISTNGHGPPKEEIQRRLSYLVGEQMPILQMEKTNMIKSTWGRPRPTSWYVPLAHSLQPLICRTLF